MAAVPAGPPPDLARGHSQHDRGLRFPGQRVAIRCIGPGPAHPRAGAAVCLRLHRRARLTPGTGARLAGRRRDVHRTRPVPAGRVAVPGPAARTGFAVVAGRAGVGGRGAARARRLFRAGPGAAAVAVTVAPRRHPRCHHRDRLGIRGRGHQGIQLSPWRGAGRRLHQLVGLCPGRDRRGQPAARLARPRLRSPGGLPARVHHRGSAGCEPARHVLVQ